MSDLSVTIVGNIIDEVVNRQTANGDARVSFRMAASRRRFNKQSQQWEDWRKLYINVTCWRELAENVAMSVKKGDPVILRGDLYTRNYIKDETSRTVFEIEPDSVGLDLTRGVASGFTRRKRGAIGAIEADPDGTPALVEPEDVLDPDEDLDSGAGSQVGDELDYELVESYADLDSSAERVLLRELSPTV